MSLRTSSPQAPPEGLALPSSFRDPVGFVYRDEGGVLLRQVNPAGRADYDRLLASGLYDELTDDGLLIPHVEVASPLREPSGADDALTLRPEPVPFISYPYEWCFGQLKDAALATLAIQKRAIGRGMSLKDASAYNIQFRRGRPVLIDTLSLEIYHEGQPWAAYRQFCEHFLAPLALMAHIDSSLGQLLRVHLDGVPLTLAARILPRKTQLRYGLLSHVHLHAAAQKRFTRTGNEAAASESAVRSREPSLSRHSLLGILDSLEATVRGLNWRPAGTAWADYYAQTNYTIAAFGEKERFVAECLDSLRVKPTMAWDLGANNGRFSRLAAERGIPTIAWDIDPAAVEKNWRACRAAAGNDADALLLPLVQDLTNPSPGLGWANRERESLAARGPADFLFALALIHHLTIANNVPFTLVARFFAEICAPAGHLIAEYVPTDDSQAQRLLARRASPDSLVGYDQESFERAFGAHFLVEKSLLLPETRRTLYLFRRSAAEVAASPSGDSEAA